MKWDSSLSYGLLPCEPAFIDQWEYLAFIFLILIKTMAALHLTHFGRTPSLGSDMGPSSPLLVAKGLNLNTWNMCTVAYHSQHLLRSRSAITECAVFWDAFSGLEK